MKAFLLLILLPIIPAKAEQPDIKCPGNTTIEMRWCASKKLDESNGILTRDKKLSPEDLKQWKEATKKVCSAAYRSYLQGSIYPQMVVGCKDHLNRALLKEFRGLGD